MRQLLLKNKFFLFVIIILSVAGCEKKNNAIIDSTGNAPILSNASFSILVVNTDTINIAGHSFRSPQDTLAIKGIAKVSVVSSDNEMEISVVRYSVTNFNSSLSEGVLRDDGIFPDVKANDSIYSGYVEFQIPRVIVGTFSVNLWSESTAGYKSNTSILPLQIVRLNRPPIISNLIAPSTVHLSVTDAFNITLKVLDSDGQSDIKSVLRFTPSGKILQLHATNDSIYAEQVALNPPPNLGQYIFRFCAVDRSNDTSNILTTTIEIAN